jgi:hypothetical protein
VIDNANDRVDSQLSINSFFSTPDAGSTYYKNLQRAAESFGLEELNMMGKIRWSTGDVSSMKEGDFSIEYQKWQPMFFFAQGDSARFNNLLPHETWRMMGMRYIDAFIKSVSHHTGKRTVAIFHDDYHRGHGRTDCNETWR